MLIVDPSVCREGTPSPCTTYGRESSLVTSRFLTALFACARGLEQEAKKLFSKFKRTIEACDLALEKKDGAKADALLQSATSIYNSWLEVVGVAV